MACEYKECRLSDISIAITKGTTPVTYGHAYTTEGVNFVKSESITPDGWIDLSKFARISPETHAALARSHLMCGDILFSMAGVYLGKTAVVTESILPANCNQAVGIIRLRDDMADPHFIAYYIRNPAYNLFLNNLVSQSAQPNFNLSEIRRLPIALPPLAEQKAIAGVLGALDDKIELNRRMNATLESMARALFQSWFVDFDPVRAKLDGRPPTGMDKATADLFPDSFQESSLGCIPKGWETGSILRQADLLSGGTPKTDVAAYWNGDVPWASAKDVSQCGEAFLLSTERTITKLGIEESSTKIIPEFATVVVARGATTGRLTMCGHSMAMNQTCYGLRTKVGAPFSLYCNVRHFIERIVQGGHGSIFDTITTSTFEATDVLLAPNELLLAFDKQVSPLFQQLHANLHQSRTHATLRDSLLPKLLSGELSVAKMKSEVSV